MHKIAQILKEQRAIKVLKLKDIANYLTVDIAIVSKIENGTRKATKKQIISLIDFYSLNEKEVMTIWLSEKILDNIKDESYIIDALQLVEYKINPDLIKKEKKVLYSEISALIDRIDILNLENILKIDKQDRFQDDIIYTYNSIKLSGNSLTYENVKEVISDGVTIPEKSMQEHLEAINQVDALEYVYDVIKNNKSLSVKIILEIHNLLLKGIDRKNAGKYRKTHLTIKARHYTAPVPELITLKMEQLIIYIEENIKTLHPIILALEIHERILTILPFIDANGRLARMLMNYILLQNNYSLTDIKADRYSKKEYIKTLERAINKKDNREFQLLICDIIIKYYK